MMGDLEPFLRSSGPLSVPQRRAGIMQGDVAGPMAKMFTATGRTRGLPDTGAVPGGAPFLTPLDIAEILRESGSDELSMPHRTDNMPMLLPGREPYMPEATPQFFRDAPVRKQVSYTAGRPSAPRTTAAPRPAQRSTQQAIPRVPQERLRVAENVGSLAPSAKTRPQSKPDPGIDVTLPDGRKLRLYEKKGESPEQTQNRQADELRRAQRRR